MAAPSRTALAVAAVILPLAACSQAPQPVKPAARTAQPAAAPSPDQAPPAANPASNPAAKPTVPPVPPAANPADKPAAAGGVVVIDPGQDDSKPRSLVEAARAERERKAHAGEPAVVITNKTLARSTGQLTYAQAKKGKTPPPAVEKSAALAPHDEAYWRKRGVEIRVRWRKATEDVDRLQKEALDLRRRFYSQDDPAVRDAQIKPEWDHALELLDRARLEVDASKAELDGFMEEGRRAGALPGWLNEGTDQEPERKLAPSSSPEAIDPPVLQESPP